MKFQVHKEELQKQFPDYKFTKDWYEFVGEKLDDTRTHSQNNALHLWFKQISDQCLEKGIDMRVLVREEVPIQCTPENIKWLWKLLQQALFGSKSTTELKKTGQMDVVYDNFNKIISERTDGEIEIPPFPSKEKEKEEFNYQYPDEDAKADKF